MTRLNEILFFILLNTMSEPCHRIIIDNLIATYSDNKITKMNLNLILLFVMKGSLISKLH